MTRKYTTVDQTIDLLLRLDSHDFSCDEVNDLGVSYLAAMRLVGELRSELDSTRREVDILKEQVSLGEAGKQLSMFRDDPRDQVSEDGE